MRADDPEARDIIRRSMVARIGTLSGGGRPSITPLYFVRRSGDIWLGTADWTLAARHVIANPRVSLLLEVERHPDDHRVLRIGGRAVVRADRNTQRAYNLRVALKYLLTPGGIRNTLAHLRQLPLRRAYRAQGAEKGRPCVIDVTPEQVELLDDLNDAEPMSRLGTQRRSSES